MAEFPLFASLPPELRIKIWHVAAHEPRRIIKVGTNIESFTCYHALADKEENVLITAFFFAQRRRPLEDLVWPSTSQQAVSSLSAACRESGDVILDEYPDTIPLASECPYTHPTVKTILYTGGNYPYQSPPAIVGKRLELRCNFNRDILCIRDMREASVIVFDDISFARDICNSSKTSGSRWTNDADNSRALLKRIKNIMIPSFDNSMHISYRRGRDSGFSVLLAAATNLERLYRCPRDNLFVDKDIKVDDFADEGWVTNTLSGAASTDLHEARLLYNNIKGRLLSPVCHTFSAAVIVETGRLVDEELGTDADYLVWKAAFAMRLAAYGFKEGQLPERRLEIKPASERGTEATGEVIWLPRPGYILEKEDSSDQPPA